MSGGGGGGEGGLDSGLVALAGSMRGQQQLFTESASTVDGFLEMIPVQRRSHKEWVFILLI